MNSLHPFVDWQLWARWLGAGVILLWLPGHLLIGHRMKGMDFLSRAVFSYGMGILLVPLLGVVFWWLRIPLRPVTYLPATLVLAFGLNAIPAYRAALADWNLGVRRLGGAEQLFLVGCGVLSAIMMVRGFGDLVAPAHIHDASNHAFMVLRVAQTGSLDPVRMFSEAGSPGILYLPGWHAAAALLSQLGNVAPYVSTWYFPAFIIVLMPAALTLMWRVWLLPIPAVLMGALFVTANQLSPTGILGWGGFGQIVGLFLVSPLVVVGRALLDRPSVSRGAIWGALLASLLFVHASEFVVVLILSGLSWFYLPRESPSPGIRAWLPALVVSLVIILVFYIPILSLGNEYWRVLASRNTSTLSSFGRAVEFYFTTGGNSVGMKVLAILGVGTALAYRKFRWLAVSSLLLGVLFVSLASFTDPVSKLLSTPFYRVPHRLSYLQILLLPPLMALPLLRLWLWAGEHWRPRVASALSLLLLAAAVVPGLSGVVVNYSNFHSAVPFGPEEYHLSKRIQETLDPERMIANFWDDGSTWAMHVSGRRFLQPCSWPLRDATGMNLRELSRGLIVRPWDERALMIRDRGIDYVYVSDVIFTPVDPPPFSRADFDADPRFEPLLECEDAVLYKILWEEG